ncbi:helicase-associated domain-containing protein [Arthrobacter sulfonylureivorans]|uniref:Helicase-associated domain-containing protein n=1 Tax=Arthrobacter sulfonylureivorans TaxID=2486855 RepID=A0ABY3W585_9MICC|nr:helicase-associated domain-containing protein [Arthrobacter sulfonylureivorans]UNK45373.1 helicase-associated domain-containing protein [Arthrobacter sulfonylureivorans]
MSSIRALAGQLAARSDAELRQLFSARPDLCLPPVPDFSALAARACTRISLQRVLENLSRPELEVLEAVVLSTDVDADRAADARSLRPLLVPPAGTAVQPDLDSYLARLQDLALLVRAELPSSGNNAFPADDGGDLLLPPAYLPVASLAEALGPYPAGLGRSYATLAASSTVAADHLLHTVRLLQETGYELPTNIPDPEGNEGVGTAAARAAAALDGWLADPRTWPALMAQAPEHTDELLGKFRRSPLGALPHPLAGTGPREATLPIDWLAAHGLLVPIDASHVELPWPAGLAVRGGAMADPWHTLPPAIAAGQVRNSLRDNAAYSAAAETLRLVAELLDQVRRGPVVTLRAGGVGVREVRRLADSLRIEADETSWLLELAAAAGLLVLDVDTSRWVVHADAMFASLPRQDQWLLLVSAWLQLDRAPSLVGGRTPSDTAINALAAEASRPDAPAVRRRVLEALEELCLPAASAGGPGEPDVAADAVPDAAATGSTPAPSPDAVTSYLVWRRPRQQRRFERLVPGILAEAARLGLVGSGALTGLGRALAQARLADAAELLAGQLPEPLVEFVLQADLTAVAPGYLAPDIAAELSLLSTAEGQGPAAIYRFSADSIRHALDAGRDAAGILGFLSRHSATDVPQPLEYLVEDTASRHGALRLGAAASFLRSDDENTLTDLLADPRTARLGLRRLAPTVAVSRTAARELLASLRQFGYAPAPEADDGVALGGAAGTGGGRGNGSGGFAAVGTPADGAATAKAGRAPSSFPVKTNPWELTAEATDAQLAALRSTGIPARPAAEAGPLLTLETLRTAIRLKQRVRIGIVDPDGNHRRQVMLPLSVSGGRLRVFDPDRDSERTVSIHRVMDIELLEGS